VYAYSLLANAARDVIGNDALGHAGGDEASAIMAIRPDLIAADRLEAAHQQPDLLRAKRIVAAAGGTLPVMMHKLSASGATGDASNASAEHGNVILGQAANQLRAIVEELLELDLRLL
jgi:creatinine amidohydrolase/Fe(II)-dependent formamide hydrolase-like protein